MTSHLVDARLHDVPDQPAENEVPKAPAYPLHVQSDEEMRRFDLAMAVACKVMQVNPNSAEAWAAARALYKSDIPT